LEACCQMTRLALTLSYVATSIPHFVSFEMCTADAFCRLRFLATLRQLAFITVLRMEAVIDVALKFTSAMKPRASANEDVPVEPLWTVVACWGAVVRSDIVVTIRTFRSYSNVDADLSLCLWGGSGEADSSNSS
jgi:hypothetical protein